MVVAIATNSLEVVAPMSIAARAGGGSSLWPGGAGGLVSCAVISKVLVTVAIPAPPKKPVPRRNGSVLANAEAGELGRAGSGIYPSHRSKLVLRRPGAPAPSPPLVFTGERVVIGMVLPVSDLDGGRWRPRRALGAWAGAFSAVWCGFLLASRRRENITSATARSPKAPHRFWRRAVSIARREFELQRRRVAFFSK